MFDVSPMRDGEAAALKLMRGQASCEGNANDFAVTKRGLPRPGHGDNLRLTYRLARIVRTKKKGGAARPRPNSFKLPKPA